MRILVALVVAVLFVPKASTASPIDFESLGDLDSITTQFPGLTFTNAVILTAGISLNEFEFPPRSGVNVASDNGGPIRIEFAATMVSVGGYFTYGSGLTLEAFDAALVSLGSVTSAFSTNMGLSGEAGSAPNEFLGLSSLAGIRSIVITGDPSGGSFTLDDLTYARDVPEPSGLLLLGIANAVAWARRRRTR